MERDTAVNRNEINKQKFISALNSKDAQIRVCVNGLRSWPPCHPFCELEIARDPLLLS